MLRIRILSFSSISTFFTLGYSNNKKSAPGIPELGCQWNHAVKMADRQPLTPG